jgi:hypothetical protein
MALRMRKLVEVLDTVKAQHNLTDGSILEKINTKAIERTG